MAARPTRIGDSLVRLQRALTDSGAADEWIAGEHTSERIELWRGARDAQRALARRTLHAELHRDLRRGRGSARFATSADDPASLADDIRAAAIRAGQSVGPPWSLPPPAAPARVDIADAEIAGAVDAETGLIAGAKPRERLVAAAEGIATALDAALRDAGELHAADVRIDVERVTRTVTSSQGFASGHLATRITLEVVLAGDGGRTVRLAHRTRRRADLDLPAIVAAAAARLAARRNAVEVLPGVYDVVLRDAALTGARANRLAWGADDEALGWFGPLAAQASGATERAGLTRYRPGQEIAPGSEDEATPLTVWSDGTIPYAERSAPIGDWGEAVRRFALVTDGRAAGLSLDVREAALRGATPNGGVRNLVISGGAETAAALLEPGARPLLEIIELGWLETDARTGRFAAELGLGHMHAAGVSAAISGGTLRGDAIALFATARRASELVDDGWYRGPAAWRFDDVVIG